MGSKTNSKCITLSYTYLESRRNIIFYNIFSTLAFVCVYVYTSTSLYYDYKCKNHIHICTCMWWSEVNLKDHSSGAVHLYVLFWGFWFVCCLLLFVRPRDPPVSASSACRWPTASRHTQSLQVEVTFYTLIQSPVLHSDRSMRSGEEHLQLSSSVGAQKGLDLGEIWTWD